MSNIFSTLRAANLVRQAEWDKEGGISLSYRGNELAGEVGEACNIIKKIERERLGIRGSRATADQLAEELADVVICADLIAMHEGIELLGKAVPAKFNATSQKYGLATRMAAASGALTDIASERRRQIEAEGWTPEHDDEHDAGEMARAASAYAYEASRTDHQRSIDIDVLPLMWPWDEKWWKSTDRRRDLVKAGALIVAEIERLDRLTAAGEMSNG